MESILGLRLIHKESIEKGSYVLLEAKDYRGWMPFIAHDFRDVGTFCKRVVRFCLPYGLVRISRDVRYWAGLRHAFITGVRIFLLFLPYGIVKIMINGEERRYISTICLSRIVGIETDSGKNVNDHIADEDALSKRVVRFMLPDGIIRTVRFLRKVFFDDMKRR